MLSPRNLDLEVSKVQDNRGLANMLYPRHLNLKINQVLRNYYPLLSTPKGTIILLWHAQGNDHPPMKKPQEMTILLWHAQRNEVTWAVRHQQHHEKSTKPYHLEERKVVTRFP